MDSETLFDKIEAYLNDQMSGSERLEFDQEIASNDALRKAVNRHRQANLVIRHGLREDWKTRLKAIDQEDAGRQPVKRRMLYRLAAAASFLLIVALGAHFYAHANYSNTALARHAFQMEPQETFRSDQSATGLAGQMSEANTLFASGHYSEAGMRYLEVAKAESLFRDQAEWNLLLCYLALDPTSDQFRIVQEKITGNPDHQYYDQALNLKKQMSGLLYRLVN